MSEALERLIEAVEAGDSSVGVKGTPLKGHGDKYQAAFHGSIDAAKALHDAVVPGWTRDVDATAPECGIDVTLWPPETSLGYARGTSGCEARAWLLAVLRAKSAEGRA